jgi:hypothetical protein
MGSKRLSVCFATYAGRLLRNLSESSRCEGKEMLADARRRFEKTGGVAYYTRPPQARQDALLPEGIVEGARYDE